MNARYPFLRLIDKYPIIAALLLLGGVGVTAGAMGGEVAADSTAIERSVCFETERDIKCNYGDTDDACRGVCATEISHFSKQDKTYPALGVIRRPGVVLPLVTLYNAHTKETLPIFEDPATKPALLRQFFRCRGFGHTIDMRPELIDAVIAASRHFEAKRVTVVSGYRSAKFNDALAKKGRRVASESKHMKGEAVDFRLDTAPASVLGPWIRANFEGGVGTYRGDDFIHIDVGPKRSWQGY